MAQKVRGVVARSKGAPVTVETIVIPDPGPGEAVVKVQACGVCHTDLHYREGGINDEFPFLLGHEAAGIVEAVGPDVSGVAPGDFVILNWRAVCGNCRSCKRGRPWYCFSTFNATQRMTLEDGTVLSPALGIGAFAEKTLVAAGQCTKVDPEARAAVEAAMTRTVEEALDALKANLAKLGTRGDVRSGSVMALGPARAPLDLIMMDPPYGTGAGLVALDKLARLGWTNAATWVSIETARDEAVEVAELRLERRRAIRVRGDLAVAVEQAVHEPRGDRFVVEEDGQMPAPHPGR